MANLPKEMADEVGKARSAGGGNYIQHGDYILMIDHWWYQKIQDRVIILESYVVESRKKVVFEGDKRVEDEPNTVGSKCSSTSNFDGAGKLSAPANSRAPMLALFNFKESEVPDATASFTLRQCCKEDESDSELAGTPIQPMRGMLVACSTFPKEIKSNKGTYITGINWECVDKPHEGLNAPDKVKARLDAVKNSPEEMIKVAVSQLASRTGVSTLPAPAVAAPLPPPPVAPVPPPADPLAGWTVNPQSPEHYYRYVNGVAEQKSKVDLLAGR